MKYLYLAFKLILKQKFLNLFLIITIVLSLSYLTPILSQVIHYVTSVHSLRCLNMDQSYYLYKNPHYNRQTSSLKKSIDTRTDSLDYITGHAESYNLYSTASSYHALSYNDTLINHFAPELDSGIWLDKAKKTNYIPAVVSYDMKLNCGNILPLELISNNVQKEFLCEIVGVLKPGISIIGFSNAADNSNFTTDALLQSSNSTIILPLTEEIRSFISNEAYLMSASGSILYTTPGIPYEEVLNDFGYAGIVTDLDDGNNRFFEQTKLICTAMGAYFVLYLTITFICLLCSSFILNISSKRIYTIYFFTGMSYKEQTVIELIRIFFLTFTGSTFSYLYLSKRGIIQMYFNTTNTFIILAGIFLYVSLIFIPAALGTMHKRGNTDIIDSIRNLNTDL